MSDTPMPRNRPAPQIRLSGLGGESDAEDARNGPWWFRAAYVFGVPTIAAGFLIWVLTARVDGNISDIKASQKIQEAQMGQFMSQQSRMEHLLQQICANGAPDYANRTACFTDGR